MVKLFANSGDSEHILWYSVASDLSQHSLLITLLWVSKPKWISLLYINCEIVYCINTFQGCAKESSKRGSQLPVDDLVGAVSSDFLDPPEPVLWVCLQCGHQVNFCSDDGIIDVWLHLLDSYTQGSHRVEKYLKTKGVSAKGVSGKDLENEFCLEKYL